MTDTYIDNDSRPAYTGIGNQFPLNLDNCNRTNFEAADIYSQIGANFMNAFFQTIMGTQHLQGNSASDIAQQAYTLAFNQSKQTQQTQQTRLTFEQWASEYMDVYETGSSDETKRKMLVYIRKHLLPFFGQMRIDEITQTDVQRFANRKSTEKCLATGRPYSHKTVKHLLDTLKKILDRAVIAGYIQKNPCIKIKNTAPPAPKRRGSTEAAQGAMIALLPQIKDERVRLWATISLSSGMRAQEIAALKWENVIDIPKNT